MKKVSLGILLNVGEEYKAWYKLLIAGALRL
jgi:hypothetical protein